MLFWRRTWKRCNRYRRLLVLRLRGYQSRHRLTRSSWWILCLSLTLFILTAYSLILHFRSTLILYVVHPVVSLYSTPYSGPFPFHIFQIGFHKSGTRTLTQFFELNGVPSLHFLSANGKLLRSDMVTNQRQNQVLVCQQPFGFFT